MKSAPLKVRKRLALVSATLSLALWPTPEFAQVTYSVTDLGALNGTTSYANGLNNSGQVVGEVHTGGPFSAIHAFLYSGGTMSDLGTLEGVESDAYGINNSGQICGVSGHAFLYSGGSMLDLGTLGGGSSGAYSINNYGQVVGESDTSGGLVHAFLYSNGTMTDLGTPSGKNYSYADGVNDYGQVVGFARTLMTSPAIAFLYTGGRMFSLGTLGGLGSTAYAINNKGQVVGEAGIMGGGTHAFLYNGYRMEDLGSLGSGDSLAYDINNNGQVVGMSFLSSLTQHAFIYNGGSMLDLNSEIPSGSGWTLNVASAINDSGQIAGSGTIHGETHAFLLTAVPEPTAWRLLALASVVFFLAKAAHRSVVCLGSCR